MNRRSFFATVVGGYFAKFFPKPKPSPKPLPEGWTISTRWTEDYVFPKTDKILMRHMFPTPLTMKAGDTLHIVTRFTEDTSTVISQKIVKKSVDKL